VTAPISRPIALLLGLFLCLNLCAGLLGAHLDGTEWLLDMRNAPTWASIAVSIAGAAVFLWFAARPRMHIRRRSLTLMVTGVLAAVAVVDVIRVLVLSSQGRVQLAAPFTFSMLVLLCLTAVAIGVLRAHRSRSHRFGLPLAAGVGALCLGGFPLLQMVLFGSTDYRRPADAILVFGARTYADGGASDALSDRMRTACDLYHQGLAPRLILSGRPGDGPVHETDAMRRFAMEAGVPDAAMIIDRAGLNTRASIQNAAALRARGITGVLAVSHFFHLPRIKLQAQRVGLACYTVPSPQGHPLNRLPYFMAREVAACWVYYLRP
jgi:uncharacterized SAM-binding protein YcdF (DUF218 family)